MKREIFQQNGSFINYTLKKLQAFICTIMFNAQFGPCSSSSIIPNFSGQPLLHFSHLFSHPGPVVAYT